MEKPTVIHEIIDYIGQFLATYGWPIVITLMVLYLSRDYLKQYQEQLSLRRAQNPHRVKILEEEMKRVRLKQQIEVNRALLEQKQKESDAATEPKKSSPRKPKPYAPPDGYNHLGGGGGLQSFKPTGGGMRGSGRRRG